MLSVFYLHERRSEKNLPLGEAHLAEMLALGVPATLTRLTSQCGFNGRGVDFARRTSQARRHRLGKRRAVRTLKQRVLYFGEFARSIDQCFGDDAFAVDRGFIGAGKAKLKENVPTLF